MVSGICGIWLALDLVYFIDFVGEVVFKILGFNEGV